MSDSEVEAFTGDDIHQCAEDMQKVVDKLDDLHDIKSFMDCCAELVLALAGNQTHPALSDTGLAEALVAFVAEIERSLTNDKINIWIISSIREEDSEQGGLFGLIIATLRRIRSNLQRCIDPTAGVDQPTKKELKKLVDRLDEYRDEYLDIVEKVGKGARLRKASKKKESGQAQGNFPPSSGPKGPVATDLTDSPDEHDPEDNRHDSKEWEDERHSDRSGPEATPSGSEDDLEDQIEKQRQEGLAQGRRIRDEALRLAQQQSRLPPSVHYGQGNGYGAGPYPHQPRQAGTRDYNRGPAGPRGSFAQGGPNAHMYPPPPSPPGHGAPGGYPGPFSPYPGGYNPQAHSGIPPVDFNQMFGLVHMAQSVPPGTVLNAGSGNMIGNQISNIGNNYSRAHYAAPEPSRRKKT